MRLVCGALLATTAVILAGCSSQKAGNGSDLPKNDAFTGHLVKDGKAITFDAAENVELKMIHETAKSFGIPIKPDGSFQIGWMPHGKYSAMLIRQSTKEKAAPRMENVPGGVTIEPGKTEYKIELGGAGKSGKG